MNKYYAYFLNLNLENVEIQHEEAKKSGFTEVVDFAFRVNDEVFEVTKDQLIDFLKSIKNDTIN